jgi:hypothetical protein
VFSAADPKTWPEKPGDYILCRLEGRFGVCFICRYWNSLFTAMDWEALGATHYARILPPGESPEEGK